MYGSMTQTGSCPHCGAPIYAPLAWWGVTPPPPQYTCNCTAHLRGTVTTTGTTAGVSWDGTTVLQETETGGGAG
jgi:hypothetical protein